MIPKVGETVISYELSGGLWCGTPWLDIGPAQDVLLRVCTGRGSSQRRFLGRAAGMFAIRVGYYIMALEQEDLADLLAAALVGLTTGPAC